MRIVLLGSGSFIAHAVIQACRKAGLEYVALRHAELPLNALQAEDCLINFALEPAYRSGAYDEAQDCDLAAARAAMARKARFVMLSTRRVYGAEARWNAVETAPALGDETAYGRNKAVTEAAVRQACGDQAGIFRLSNIFGYEYSVDRPRRSFLGLLLSGLRNENTISFDMDAKTRRDFLPVETCAQELVARAIDGTSGVHNLGAGFPVACGSLAEWVLDGFGSGTLICDPPVVKDEFYLNMDAWRGRFGPPITEAQLRHYCVEIGRRLRCEKS